MTSEFLKHRWHRIGGASRRRCGMALFVVMALIALATMMAFAILGAASIQGQVSLNERRGATVDSDAESALATARYYLMNPDNAPLLNASGVYPGQTSINLGSSIGTADVATTSLGNDQYQVDVTAYGPASQSEQFVRKLRSYVQVNSSYVIDQGLSSNGNLSLPSLLTVNGKVRAKGALTVVSPGQIHGAMTAANGTETGTIQPLPTYPLSPAPTRSELTIITTITSGAHSYTYNGRTYQADAAPTTINSTLTANATTNPANVYYATGAVTMNAATLNGTLILTSTTKDLRIRGTCRITPMAGMPGLIVSHDLKFNTGAAVKQLTVDGLLWIGGSVISSSGTSTNCTLVVNGAMMFGGTTGAFDSAVHGVATLNYVAANVNIPDLSTANRTPQSMKTLQWGSQ